jgi:hypothetical protein
MLKMSSTDPSAPGSLMEALKQIINEYDHDCPDLDVVSMGSAMLLECAPRASAATLVFDSGRPEANLKRFDQCVGTSGYLYFLCNTWRKKDAYTFLKEHTYVTSPTTRVVEVKASESSNIGDRVGNKRQRTREDAPQACDNCIKNHKSVKFCARKHQHTTAPAADHFLDTTKRQLVLGAEEEDEFSLGDFVEVCIKGEWWKAQITDAKTLDGFIHVRYLDTDGKFWGKIPTALSLKHAGKSIRKSQVRGTDVDRQDRLEEGSSKRGGGGNQKGGSEHKDMVTGSSKGKETAAIDDEKKREATAGAQASCLLKSSRLIIARIGSWGKREQSAMEQPEMHAETWYATRF